MWLCVETCWADSLLRLWGSVSSVLPDGSPSVRSNKSKDGSGCIYVTQSQHPLQCAVFKAAVVLPMLGDALGGEPAPVGICRQGAAGRRPQRASKQVQGQLRPPAMQPREAAADCVQLCLDLNHT